MAIITKDELLKLNSEMVGRGEPIEIDNKGYNKCHFYNMLGLSFNNDLTTEQAYAIADTLYFYSNTQLNSIKDDLRETLNNLESELTSKFLNEYGCDKGMFKYLNYEEQEAEKERIREEKWSKKRKAWIEERLGKKRQFEEQEKEITVVDKNSNFVLISWVGFIDGFNNLVKSFGYKNCHWKKDDSGNWVLQASWEVLPKILDELEMHNYRNETLRDNLEFFDVFIEEQKLLDERRKKENPVNIAVERNENEVDTLNVYFNKVFDNSYINSLCKTLKIQKSAFFRTEKNIQGVRIQMSAIPELYDFLKESTQFAFNLECEELKKWRDKILDWEKDDCTLIDISKLNLSFTPYEFQPKDAEILLKAKRFINANEMGCGKTFEQVVVGESIPDKKLVVVPETLRLNWQKEIKNVNPNANIKVIRSKDKEVTFSNDWNIVGYKTLSKFKNVIEKANFNVVMLDEAHLCKAINNYGEPTSKRAKDVLRICAPAKYVYPITGTPKPNRNKDLFNLFRLVKEPFTREGFFNFGVEYCDGYNNGYGWDFTGNSNDEKLYKVLSKDMVRHLRKDVLPNLTKSRTFIPLECNLKKYQAEIDKFLEAEKKGNTEEGLGYIMTARRILSNIKVEQSIDYANSILDENKQVVIACSFRDSLAKIKETYGDNCVVIQGGMTDKDKERSIELFQSGKAKVCAVNIKAGGVGITLNASQDMIINDYEWLPADMVQMEDRICRGAGELNCNIMYMYAEHADMDELFTKMLSEKLATINETVDNNLGESFDMRDEVLSALCKKNNIMKSTKKLTNNDRKSVPQKPSKKKSVER